MAKDEADQAFDDLLWELDVTTVRSPESEAPVAAAPSQAEDGSAQVPEQPSRRAPRPKAPPRSKRGQFYRPELEPTWKRVLAHPALKVSGAVALLAGTGALVATALMR